MTAAATLQQQRKCNFLRGKRGLTTRLISAASQDVEPFHFPSHSLSFSRCNTHARTHTHTWAQATLLSLFSLLEAHQYSLSLFLKLHFLSKARTHSNTFFLKHKQQTHKLSLSLSLTLSAAVRKRKYFLFQESLLGRTALRRFPFLA